MPYQPHALPADQKALVAILTLKIRTETVQSRRPATIATMFTQVFLGRVAWPSVNPRLHQSELMMEAADTNVTLQFSNHLRNAWTSPQFSSDCLK